MWIPGHPPSATTAVGTYLAPSGFVIDDTNRISVTRHTDRTGTPAAAPGTDRARLARANVR
jgi:hypothetical protein